MVVDLATRAEQREPDILGIRNAEGCPAQASLKSEILFGLTGNLIAQTVGKAGQPYVQYTKTLPTSMCPAHGNSHILFSDTNRNSLRGSGHRSV